MTVAQAYSDILLLWPLKIGLSLFLMKQIEPSIPTSFNPSGIERLKENDYNFDYNNGGKSKIMRDTEKQKSKE